MYKTVIIVEDSKDKKEAITAYIREIYPSVRFEYFWSFADFVSYLMRMKGAMKRYRDNYLVIMDLYYPKVPEFPDQISCEGCIALGYMRRKMYHVDTVICATEDEIASATSRMPGYSNILGYITYNQESRRLCDDGKCIETKERDSHS